MNEPLQRQANLPLRKILRIAWRNIRVRLWRSLLVTSGIILALAFLSYILASETLLRFAAVRGSASLLESLRKSGLLLADSSGDQRAQTYWMVALALLICFVGVLNAMIMSVTERFREIGTMKCLGALDAFIIQLYLIESLFQGVIGTLIGMAVGVLLAYLEGASLYGAETLRLIPPDDFLRMLGICFCCGLGLTVAGALYPAWRAARMEPIHAMRAEV